MLYRSSAAAIALAAALCMASASARAFDESKYPDLRGKWDRVAAPRWVGEGQKAPLTPEYQALFDRTTAEQKAGGHGYEVSWRCLPPGMPRIMLAYEPMEILVTPEITHILISHIHDNRRIYTDGRDWPAEPEPTFKGYSIGKWIDTDGDGRYDTLEVETRYMKGPRAYDTSGLPLATDNKTIVKERIYVDRNDRMAMWDEITVIDHALTGPWTVKKKYTRDPNPSQHNWIEEVCAENNPHIQIQNDNYMLSAEGVLMPAKPGQAAPDLRYFKRSQK
jgi:hypothetical protein